MRVAVIGGGPSGLVTLKYLATAHEFFPIQPVEARLFESASSIGGVFFHHSYEDGELVSSKYLTTFSDLLPEHTDPDFYKSEQYLAYMHKYADKFDLWKNINLNSPVLKVRRRDGGGHTVTYKNNGQSEESWDCDAVAVCTGLHHTPNIPDIKGAENIPVRFHSSDFKSREQFGKDKTVMIVGTGETSFDIADLAMKSDTKKVVLCGRSGFLGLSKRLPRFMYFPKLRGLKDEDFIGWPHEGNNLPPVDGATATLFDSMNINRHVRDSLFVWDHYNTSNFKFSWLYSGTTPGYCQWIARVPKDEGKPQEAIFNKAHDRVLPYIHDYQPKPEDLSLVHKIRLFIVRPVLPRSPRTLDMAPMPSHFDSMGTAHFTPDESKEYAHIASHVVKPDVLIYATGYTQTFPFFAEQNAESASGPPSWSTKPYATPATADVRALIERSDPTVGFVGFVRPNLGAIPALAEMQAQLWVLMILGRLDPATLDPNDEPHYRLLLKPHRRVRYGVDHDSYAYQLACDVDGAAYWTDLAHLAWQDRWVRGGRLLFIWACGANYVAKFRLRGPWARPHEMTDALTGVLYECIQRRGGTFGNFTLSYMPIMVLGTASLIMYLWVLFWDVLSKTRLCRPVKYVNRLKQIEDEYEAERQRMAINGGSCTKVNGIMRESDPMLANTMNGNGYGSV